MIPDFHYNRPEYPSGDATEEEMEAYFIAMDEYTEKYAQWEYENRWKLRTGVAFAIMCLPFLIAAWIWDYLTGRWGKS
ncbi:membrane protein [Arthrobacter phage Qui]|uniref:Membrane protein n=1 Tax=Arthrobacter phage Qui TaxID=2603260 RepID=A0A5B8WM30_9CAUD|nr:membrane protein [Arthrobacter phage Qui]QED11672.1 membrane protein [Arthrobacter phage Qui]QOC56503.1 hypothetical protein SEA_PAELLA_184 [Arthrobacter phage Paella]